MAALVGCDMPTTSTASYPFNDPKADFIIRSSDSVHFYIHKSLLSIVSPVFEEMLTLPQETHDGRPCLPVDDNKSHLFCLLSWCDRRSNELKPTLDDLIRTLSISKKYGVDSMFRNAQKDLLAHLPVESFTVYAIAIRFQLNCLARKAAQETLQLSLASSSSLYLEHISAFAIQNLHNYHSKCKEALRDLLASESWVKSMRAATHHLASYQEDQENLHTHGLEYFKLKKLTVVGGGALWISTGRTASWWVDYMEAIMYIINERPNVRPLPLLQWIKKSISLDKCNQCRKHGYERLDTVSWYLVKIIDETISKVPFEVKY
jgi:hypothetical protein